MEPFPSFTIPKDRTPHWWPQAVTRNRGSVVRPEGNSRNNTFLLKKVHASPDCVFFHRKVHHQYSKTQFGGSLCEHICDTGTTVEL